MTENKGQETKDTQEMTDEEVELMAEMAGAYAEKNQYPAWH